METFTTLRSAKIYLQLTMGLSKISIHAIIVHRLTSTRNSQYTARCKMCHVTLNAYFARDPGIKLMLTMCNSMLHGKANYWILFGTFMQSTNRTGAKVIIKEHGLNVFYNLNL
ncbi:unnamed protein product [Larinioides sclopetarius]|uniref:Uncharacterized protein n=1 Tax=Larinioides sclopetarius TaxID=280406 RepID=A0AAV2BNV1_9ARAC